MKVNIVSTAPPTKCGIGITNSFLMDGMGGLFNTHDLSQVGIELYSIKKPASLNPFYFIGLAFKTAVNSNTKNGDIIHIQYNHDCFGTIGKKINGFQNIFFYPILKFLNARIITTFHEVTDLSNSSIIKKIFYRILNFCPLHMSDHIIVTTKRAKEILINQDKLNSSKLTVIPLGASPNQKRIDNQIAKHSIGIHPSKKVITLFGFVDTNKGHHKLIEILPYLREDTLFLIAGEPRSEKGKKYFIKLNQLISQLNLSHRVHFYGFVKEEEHQKVLSASDILVYPYSDITSSLSLTTALSYKVPILTSAILPFQEFKDNFKCINTVDVDNKEKFIKAINTLLRKGEPKQLIAHRENFINNFSWKNIAKKTIDVYHKVAL